MSTLFSCKLRGPRSFDFGSHEESKRVELALCLLPEGTVMWGVWWPETTWVEVQWEFCDTGKAISVKRLPSRTISWGQTPTFRFADDNGNPSIKRRRVCNGGRLTAFQVASPANNSNFKLSNSKLNMNEFYPLDFFNFNFNFICVFRYEFLS